MALLCGLEKRRPQYVFSCRLIAMKDIDPQPCLDDILRTMAEIWAKTPNKTALKEGEEELTFAMLDGRATHLARAFDEKGAAPGDFVGYLGPTGIPFVVTFFACLKAGLVFMPISPKFPPMSVAAILRAADARFFVSDHDMPEAASGVWRWDCRGTMLIRRRFRRRIFRGRPVLASSTREARASPRSSRMSAMRWRALSSAIRQASGWMSIRLLATAGPCGRCR